MRLLLCLTVLFAVACGKHRTEAVPAPVVDPARTVDSLWTLGVTEYNRGHWGRAQRIFDQLAPAVSFSDERYLQLHFFQGEILFAQNNQLQAVREFRRVADERPEGPLAPDALLRAGDAYADLWRRPELDPTYGETARTVYEEVASRYGGTPAAGRAAIRLATLGEKFADKEFRNALFYFKFKAWDSAILMFRSLIANYPNAPVVPLALERLVRTYQILGYQEDIKETCAYIAQYQAGATEAAKRCPKDKGPETATPPHPVERD